MWEADLLLLGAGDEEFHERLASLDPGRLHRVVCELLQSKWSSKEDLG